jgi:hypothetical protein
MANPPTGTTAPPTWSEADFLRDLEESIELFRRQRMEEPLEDYIDAFEDFQGYYEDLLERTVDLTNFDSVALDVLTDRDLLSAFRYLAGPPISADDLKTIAEASLSPSKLRRDPESVRRIVQIVLMGLDRKRFPWVLEHREPTEAERQAAVLASAALLATSRVGTQRRHEGKGAQERRVEEALLGCGFVKVANRNVGTLGQAPAPGEFCGESSLAGRKADFVVRLWDTRVMPIECKVSNSAVNPVKRLNNDAAAKAAGWLDDLGRKNAVPVAVLSGVFKIHNLIDAQARGLTLFWAHNLNAMTDWIGMTKPTKKR